MSRILSLRLIHAMHALTSRNLTINPQTVLSVLASSFSALANHLAVAMTTSHSTPTRQLFAAGGGGGRLLAVAGRRLQCI